MNLLLRPMVITSSIPALLLRSVLQVMDEVMNVQGHPPIAVSFSSAMHGLIAVDKNGAPITGLITWADLRSTKQAESLKASGSGARIYERTGTPIHPMSPLCKLMWLKEMEPVIFNNAYKFISIKEFVFYHFFGEYIIDHSIASATGLFDIYDLGWNEEALAIAGISAERLSQPVPVTHFLRNEKGIPFVIGGSDGCLAHIGSSALANGDVSLTIGTSGAVRVMNTAPIRDPRARIFNYVLTKDRYISGGPVNNGGNVLQWFAANFLKKSAVDGDDYEEIINDALTVAPGSDGLVFLPYIFGERAPVWDANAKGVFYGVTSVHTIAHFQRAILEGISFGLLSVLQSIQNIQGSTGNIYVSGGFVKSAKWVALLADILGKPLHVTQSQDSSASGAAIVAMKALGIINSFDDTSAFFKVDRIFEPDMAAHDACRINYAVYSELYDKLKDIKH